MRLSEPFLYVGPDGTEWPVPAGTVTDGASIPQVFWSVIGGPFEGAYRNAAVIHDFYCQTRIRPCKIVHLMFHEAILASGVDSRRAWLMYEAVDVFGPKWSDPKVDPECQVVTEKYDFTKCALNSNPPPVSYPTITSTELLKFAKQMKSQADQEDLDKIRAAANNIKP